MIDDGGIRASDSDRENVVEILREAYSAGRLTLEEFDERTTAAFAARTWGTLRELTGDLPHQPRLGISQAGPQQPTGPRGPREPLPGRPPWRLSPMLPILVLWLGVAAAAQEPIAFIPVFLILLAVLRFGGRPGRHHEPDRREHPDPGPGRLDRFD